MIVPAEARIQYQVAFRHDAFLALDGRERAGAFNDEAERHHHVAMGCRVLAGMDGLQSQLKRMGRNAAPVFDAGINQSDHAPVAVLGTHQLSGPDEAFVTVFPLPEKGFYVGCWLWRDT